MSSILQNGNGARTHSDARAPVHPLFNSPPPPVDQVAVEERAAQLAKRSIKKSAKVAGLRPEPGRAFMGRQILLLSPCENPEKYVQVCV